MFCIQDARKKREEERQKQLRWREEHRNALLQGHESVDTGESYTGRINRDTLAPISSSIPEISPPQRSQVFKQKQWRRGERSCRPMADSFDSGALDKGIRSKESPKYNQFQTSKDFSEMDTLPLGSLLPVGSPTLEPILPIPSQRSGSSKSMTPDSSEKRRLTDKPVHLIDFCDRDEVPPSRTSWSRTSSPPIILSGSLSSLARRRSLTPERSSRQSPQPSAALVMLPPPRHPRSRPPSHQSLLTSPARSRDSPAPSEVRDFGVQTGEHPTDSRMLHRMSPGSRRQSSRDSDLDLLHSPDLKSTPV